MTDLAFDLRNAPSTDPISIYRYRDGLYAADLLTCALVYLDLFTWLDKSPSSKAGICQHFATAERPTDVMLTLLTAMGLIERGSDGTFSVTKLAREHLVSRSPW